MKAVAIEEAQKEVTDWLDYKKVSESKRETYKDNIDALAGFVSEGVLSLQENVFTHTLKFAVGEGGTITKLEYKPRLSMKTVNEQLQGVKATDADARIVAYIAALTGQPKNVIKLLDTEDYAVAQAIAVFFV